MYLYNTTFVIDESEVEWWADWMRRSYMPTIFEMVPNVNNEIYKVEGNAQTAGSLTFSCQWRCYTLQELGEVERYDKALSKNLMDQKGEKCLTFSTMMKGVEL